MKRHALAAAVWAAITAAPLAYAEPLLKARGLAARNLQGGVNAGTTQGARTDQGAFGRRQGVHTDGQGNAAGGAQGGFATSGARGAGSRHFERSADGSMSGSGEARASGTNGSARTSGSFTRSADGSGSGERTTSATNANSGVTYEGSTSYAKGSGLSHSGSCRDAYGNTVDCGPR